jgi:propanol-preferring alcohol dehydrogenase
MQAMVLSRAGACLARQERPDPEPGAGEVRLRVLACAVCRTDLHVVDGELRQPRLPLVPGHEIVGVVDRLGDGVTSLQLGQRAGVPWLGHVCGHCPYCIEGRENLCDKPRFTGYTRDGGFATHVVAEAAFCFPLPDLPRASVPGGPQDGWLDAVHAAPLMCAGLIGWRALKQAGGDVRELGIYGFGAAAHLITQVAVQRGIRVHAFTRGGDEAAQAFALQLGATSAGASDGQPPVPLDAAIIFAPVGELVPLALRAVRKGGRVVCGGIYMTPIPAMDYALLWEERELVSVANLTRDDAREFLAAAAATPLFVEAHAYALSRANEALDDLRSGRIVGAAVLVP